jgi:hypothetical protein
MSSLTQLKFYFPLRKQEKYLQRVVDTLIDLTTIVCVKGYNDGIIFPFISEKTYSLDWAEYIDPYVNHPFSIEFTKNIREQFGLSSFEANGVVMKYGKYLRKEYEEQLSNFYDG